MLLGSFAFSVQALAALPEAQLQSRRSPIDKLGVPSPEATRGVDVASEAQQTPASADIAARSQPGRRLSLGVDVEVYQRFLWRGAYYSQAPVLQPSAWVREAGLEASIWFNVMLGREAGPPLSLVSPALGYQSTWARGDFGAGLLLYLETSLEVVPPTSGEAYATFSFAMGHAALRTSQYVHYLGAPGAYYGEFGPEYDRELGAWSGHAALVLGWASARYNALYFDVPNAAVNTASLTLRATRAFDTGLYIGAQLESTAMLYAPLTTARHPFVGSFGLAFGYSH